MKRIGRLTLASVVMCFVLSALGLTAEAQVREYIRIAPEGARASTAFGINARGDIVGSFVDDQTSVTHGFLLSKGEFTVIDFPATADNPAAAGTIARGISPSGKIVGNYWLPGDPAVASRGFLLTKKGEFVDVRYPGHSWEVAQRILPNGTILGCRHDTDQMATMRGVTIGKDGPSEIEAFGSMNNGATPDLRVIAGFWFNMMANQQQGYTIEDGVFTPFMVPGSNLTNAWDVNPEGVIVGTYRVGIGVGAVVRGFVRTGDSYSTIHYPESTVTRTFGINDSGDVVGNYVLGGRTYAYLARVIEE
ncbi:MAG: hypothetical protein ABJB49_04415 [Nitrospirota bacterium]